MKGHGDINLTITKNIIMFDVIGSFNEEGAKTGYKKLKKAIKSFKDSPYYIIENILKFTGATPQAYVTANKENEWINKHNPPVMRLFVVNDRIHTSIALNQEKELAKQNIMYFTDKESALDWVFRNQLS